MSDIDIPAVAQALRMADFAMERAVTAFIAFAPDIAHVRRDVARLGEARQLIAAVLPSLPPEPPLTEEEERWCADLIGRALRRLEQ